MYKRHDYIKSYVGEKEYNATYLASWVGSTNAFNAYVVKKVYNTVYEANFNKWFKKTYYKNYGSAPYTKEYEKSYLGLFVGTFDKNWIGEPATVLYNKEYAGLAIYQGAARTSAVTTAFMGGVYYQGPQTWGGYSNSIDTTEYEGVSGYIGYTGSPRYTAISGFTATFTKDYVGTSPDVNYAKNYTVTYTAEHSYLGSTGYATYNAPGSVNFIGPRLWNGFVQAGDPRSYLKTYTKLWNTYSADYIKAWNGGIPFLGELYYEKVYTKAYGSYSKDYTKSWRKEQSYEGTWTANFGTANYIGATNLSLIHI